MAIMREMSYVPVAASNESKANARVRAEMAEMNVPEITAMSISG
jgi:hypothetical protein